MLGWLRDEGQCSRGISKVDPSGAVGELGDVAPWWIFRNCFATRPLHVLDFGLVRPSGAWEDGFRVLLTGD